MMLPSEVWSGATTALVSSGQMLSLPFTRTAPKRSPVEQRRSTATSVVRPATRSNIAEPGSWSCRRLSSLRDGRVRAGPEAEDFDRRRGVGGAGVDAAHHGGRPVASDGPENLVDHGAGPLPVRRDLEIDQQERLTGNGRGVATTAGRQEAGANPEQQSQLALRHDESLSTNAGSPSWPAGPHITPEGVAG